MKIIPVSLKNIKAKYFDAIVKPTEYYTPGVPQKVLYCICPADNTEGIVAQTNSMLLNTYEVLDTFPASDKACIVCGGGFYRDLEDNVVFLANEDYYIIYVQSGVLNIKAKVDGVTIIKENILSNVTCISAVYGWQTLDIALSDTDLGICIAYATPSGTFLLRVNQYTLEGAQTIQLNAKGLVTGVDVTLTDDYRLSIIANYPGGSIMHLSDRYWVGGAVLPETIVGRFNDRGVSQVLTQFLEHQVGNETIKGRFGSKDTSTVGNAPITALYAYNEGINVIITFDGDIDTSSIDITSIVVADIDGVVFAPELVESNTHQIIVSCVGINNFYDSVTVSYKGAGLRTPAGTTHANPCSYSFVPVGLVPDDLPPPVCLGAYVIPGGNNGTEVYTLFDRRIRNQSFAVDDLSAVELLWTEYAYTVGQSDVVGENGERLQASTVASALEVLSTSDLPEGHTLPIDQCVDTSHTVVKITAANTFRNAINDTNITVKYNSALGHFMGTKPVADFEVATIVNALVPYPRIYVTETCSVPNILPCVISTKNTLYESVDVLDNPVVTGRFKEITVAVENTGQIVP